MARAVVIGGGPAGLMAADVLATAGHAVTVVEAKPSLGRKLLMAGKSGLNLTKAEPSETFLAAYAEASDWLRPMLTGFGPAAVREWAEGLGQETFAGSTGRVFPRAMKASPLLRAWLGRLGQLGVTVHTRWRWTGWDGDALTFATPEGAQSLYADATVLALGGASWARLGSDGAWAPLLADKGVGIARFAPANAGVAVDWSRHMEVVMGQPVKGVAFRSGPYHSRGEAVISKRGLEGSGIYAVSRGVREGCLLSLDLLPDLTHAEVARRLTKPRGRETMSNHLRKTLKLPAANAALLREFGQPLPLAPELLAATIKGLTVRHAGLRPLDEAISTAGGVRADALDDSLMLTALPGVYCAGEMLDWEAPTGGYLLTACLATGRWAGLAAAARLSA
ncbi:MAG: TIGR03862 family flavoprotein [Pseudooceanicola sp.]|nr:TIGR03862 family flavoprotein [Pseudooceanicola sp.]